MSVDLNTDTRMYLNEPAVRSEEQAPKSDERVEQKKAAKANSSVCFASDFRKNKIAMRRRFKKKKVFAKHKREQRVQKQLRIDHNKQANGEDKQSCNNIQQNALRCQMKVLMATDFNDDTLDNVEPVSECDFDDDQIDSSIQKGLMYLEN